MHTFVSSTGGENRHIPRGAIIGDTIVSGTQILGKMKTAYLLSAVWTVA